MILILMLLNHYEEITELDNIWYNSSDIHKV